MPTAAHTFEDAALLLRAAVNAFAPRRLAIPGFRPAAVLIPLLRRPGGPTLLFTRRTETVEQHKGQICFPGGRCEDAEEARAGALREAFEEVALEPAAVEVLGTLDDYPSISGYIVTPVVGLVREPPAGFRPQETEVQECLEIPLARLLDSTRLRVELWETDRLPSGAFFDQLRGFQERLGDIDQVTGRHRIYFFDAFGDPERVVWGLTARILKGLLERAFGFVEC